jgi:hypothetical protein
MVREPESSAVSRTLIIKTQPACAVVYENGDKVCACTPCEVTYKGRDADPNKGHKIYISRGDFCDSDVRTVRIGAGPSAVVQAKLQCFTGDNTGVPSMPELPY